LPEGLPAGKFMAMAEDKTSEIDPELLKNPLFQELMAEGLAMQDRFSAEPVYAKTGKGFLKSSGVEEIKQAKEAEKAKRDSEAKGE
jgi:hypothetical protein